MMILKKRSDVGKSVSARSSFRGLAFVASLLAGMTVGSCVRPVSGDGRDPSVAAPQENTGTSKVYVLCEGLYGMNNTSLFCWDVVSGQTVKDVFREKNRRSMGDTGNDLEIYGNKMYAVMNGSNLIEVMDVQTALSVKQIPMVDSDGVGRQPRYLCAYGGKIYVASFDNTVCRIDTASLEIEAVVQVGRNPDGICAVGGKLYVSNSGGLDYPDYDNTVSVVDLASFTETRRIEVGGNPYTVACDSRGYVYVSTRGDYDGFEQNPKSGTGDGADELVSGSGQAKKEGYGFYRIDPATGRVDRDFGIPVLSFCIYGDTAYLYRYDYNTEESAVMVMDLLSEKIVQEDFIGERVDLQTPYAIAVDPFRGQVLIGEAYNYMRSGSVYCFDRSGNLLQSFHSVGLNPSSFAFLPR